MNGKRRKEESRVDQAKKNFHQEETTGKRHVIVAKRELCGCLCTHGTCYPRTYLTAGNEISRRYVSPFCCWRPVLLASGSSLVALNKFQGVLWNMKDLSM